ncbi:MAG: tetratricopeptide repeat protein [Chitinivibrionales bacterium]|nr:tetratricopeptide repeat protein [Chitinivibrionales bacterium]
MPANTIEANAAENKRAEDFITQGDLAAAARILVDIIEKDPGDARAYNNIGLISWTRHAWEDAHNMFKKAADLKPDYTDTLINLFDAALKLRRVNDALPYFDRCLKVNPGVEEIKIIRDAIANQGDEIYKSERGLMVGCYNPGIEAADRLVEEGKYMEAMQKYLHINDTEGPSAETYTGLGVVSYYQKRFEDSYQLFYEGIKLNPLNADLFLNFLDAAKACGKAAEAKLIFNEYLRNFPALKPLALDFEKA